jgi:DNA-binding HxlR family transcriptional regulator
MQRKSFSGMNCSIARSLEEVGEWWSLLIVRECTQGTARFDEFQNQLGIARNVLTARLERLTELGILERFPLEDRANTDGYRLTGKGEELYPVLVALTQWGDRWLAPNGKPPTTLLDDATGAPIEQIAVRGKRGKPLSFRNVRFAPGPGAGSSSQGFIDKRNQRILGPS